MTPERGSVTAGGLLVRLRGARAVELEPDEARTLVEAGRLVREVDTRLAGMLRVLELDGALVVQEQTTRGRHVARVVPSLEAAEALICDRLAVYERMWDGCGCKVDYLG